MQGTGALIAVPGASVWGHPEQHEAHREVHNFGVTKALQEPLVHLVIPLITGVLHFFGLVAVPVPEEVGELQIFFRSLAFTRVLFVSTACRSIETLSCSQAE